MTVGPDANNFKFNSSYRQPWLIDLCAGAPCIIVITYMPEGSDAAICSCAISNFRDTDHFDVWRSTGMRYLLAWATTWVRWIPGNFDDRGVVVAGRCMAPKKMSSVIRPGACIPQDIFWYNCRKTESGFIFEILAVATTFLRAKHSDLVQSKSSNAYILRKNNKAKEMIDFSKHECPTIAETMVTLQHGQETSFPGTPDTASANLRHPTTTAFTKTLRQQKGTAFPVPGIEPGSFRCFRSEDVKAEYPSLWTIRELVLLMRMI